MNVCVVKDDNVVVVDGDALNFDFNIDKNIHAIQWNGTSGHIEFNDGTPNKDITDFSDYQYLVDEYTREKEQQVEESNLAESARLASMTYSDKRRIKYESLNQFEMQFDDAINGTTTWIDAIKAIKLEIPKS